MLTDRVKLAGYPFPDPAENDGAGYASASAAEPGSGPAGEAAAAQSAPFRTR